MIQERHNCYTCSLTHMHPHMHPHTHASTHTCIHTHTHTHPCTHTHTLTNTHTHSTVVWGGVQYFSLWSILMVISGTVLGSSFQYALGTMLMSPLPPPHTHTHRWFFGLIKRAGQTAAMYMCKSTGMYWSTRASCEITPSLSRTKRMLTDCFKFRYHYCS